MRKAFGSTYQGREREAEQVARAAVSAYRHFVDTTGEREAKRRLGKALWRHAMVLNKVSMRPVVAMTIGGGRHWVRKKRCSPRPRRTILRLDANRGRTRRCPQRPGADSSRGGRIEERERLLVQALEISKRSGGPAARHAIGTSLFNLAQHRFQVLVELVEQERQHMVAPESIPETVKLAQAAVDVRREILSAE